MSKEKLKKMCDGVLFFRLIFLYAVIVFLLNCFKIIHWSDMRLAVLFLEWFISLATITIYDKINETKEK